MPGDPAIADSNRGEALLAQGRLDEAAQVYRRSIALTPDAVEPHFGLGIVLGRQRRLDEAVASYERAIALDPDRAQIHLNLGSIYRRQGRLDDAAAAYARALAIRPDYAMALHNLGNVHQLQGRFDDAEIAFRRAVALQPDLAEAHYSLGVMLRKRGQPEAAVEALRSVVALKPGDAAAFYNLGIALEHRGMPDEAEAALRQALALKPDYAEAHYALGVSLSTRGRLDEAADSYRKALAVRPDYAAAHNNLGTALEHQGRFTEAAASFRRAIDLQPSHAEAHYNLVQQTRMNDGSPDTDAAFALLSGQVEALDTFGPSEREMLQFAMAKALEDRGEFDRAFSYMAAANAARRTDLSFDIAAVERLMADIAEVFDGPLLQRLKDAGPDSERPIFIVGMPRSGTSLVEQIISAHPAVHGAGEISTLAEVVGAVRSPGGSGYPDWGRVLAGADCRRIGQAYLDGLPRSAPGETRVTDKTVSNFEFIGLIHLCLPQARIIHCRRDPRDTAVSCFAARFSRGQEQTYDLAELGRYWRAYDRLMDHWRAVLPPGRMLEVPYEAVVDDLEIWARRLIGHCGLEWDDACLRFHESSHPVLTGSFAQVRRPIYSSSVGRWRRFAPHLNPLLEALGEPWASLGTS